VTEIKFVSIVADESTDISNQLQLIMVYRYEVNGDVYVSSGDFSILTNRVHYPACPIYHPMADFTLWHTHDVVPEDISRTLLAATYDNANFSFSLGG
jgi:hypothetical protein